MHDHEGLDHDDSLDSLTSLQQCANIIPRSCPAKSQITAEAMGHALSSSLGDLVVAESFDQYPPTLRKLPHLLQEVAVRRIREPAL